MSKKKSMISDSDLREAVIKILTWMGEDINREGLRETPDRVVKAMKEYFIGYNQDPAAILGKSFEDIAGYNDIVILSGLRVESHCEHHIAPIVGYASIGYIPNGKVVGISKLSRLVNALSKRLQLQERLTKEIMEAIDGSLSPLGTAVHIKAKHFCLSKRGIHDDNAIMTTTSFSGEFMGNGSEPTSLRSRFLSLIDK